MPLRFETGLLFRELAAGEKQQVALSSVAAGAFLTMAKLAVAAGTGSLGILAEAVHSGLDLLAAGVTYVAVRVADRPADASHPYGHGKLENLAALVEAVLLLVTSGWIFYEGLERLLVRPRPVTVNVWAFGVMILSIIVDWSRSRALTRAARTHRSQALEADALHFQSDIWSSLVVLAGLVLVYLAPPQGPLLWLRRADAAAAIAVALIVTLLTVRLSRQAVDVLLDRAPLGVAEEIGQGVAEVAGVVEVRSVRSRQIGPQAFVDMTIGVGRTIGLEEAHGIASRVEARVREIVPQADVTVHVEPQPAQSETLVDRIRAVAHELQLAVHHIAILEVEGDLTAHLHLEVDEDLSLEQAHAIATDLEKTLEERFEELKNAETHIEPAATRVGGGSDLTPRSRATVERVREIALQTEGVRDCHRVAVHHVDGDLTLSLHVLFDGQTSIGRVHGLLGDLETQLRRHFPEAGTVHIHPEPYAQRRR